MPKCDFCEIRGWGGNAYCLKKDNYVDNSTYDDYCNTYHFDNCPIYKSGSGGGCYLTTACVETKNLPDDCRELTVLRTFRDEYLANQPTGKAEIQEYYETAPKIVGVIDNQSDRKEIYEKLYNNTILPCVELIEKGNNAEAYGKYKEMVQKLKRQFM